MVKRGLDSAIYDLIRRSPNPISTREIALSLKIAWHTTDRHCLKLKLDGKVDYFIIGRSTAWFIKK